MSHGLATRGYISPLVGTGGGGGGGGGASGIVIPFEMVDDDGVYHDSIDFTGLIKLSVYGAAFGVPVNVPVNISGTTGAYYLELDSTEVQTNWVWLKIVKAGYRVVSIVWNIDEKVTTDDLGAAVTTLSSAISAARDAIESDVANVADAIAGSQVGLSVPATIDIPAAATRTFLIELFTGATLDANPTVAVIDQDGASKAARLDSTTMSTVSAGRYRATYTSTAGDAVADLKWQFSVAIDGTTRKFGADSHLGNAEISGSVDAHVVSVADDAFTADAFADDAFDGVWSVVLEGSSTAGDMMRGALSILAGKVTNFLSNTLVFKGAINAAKTRWSFTVDETGRLTSTPGDLT